MVLLRVGSHDGPILTLRYATCSKYSTQAKAQRSYWIPGSYAPALSKKRNSFLSLLKNKGFKEERMTKVGLYAIGKSTTLESNKSLFGKNQHPS